ncbi:MAG: hypothetical protein WCL36_07800 [bacterium]
MTKPVTKPTANRRQFLTAVAGTTAAVAATGFSARELLGQARTFPEYPTPQGGWDMTWADKVEKTKHRMLFDMPEMSDGLAFTNTLTWLRGYSDVYKTADSEMGGVVVIRHQAIAAAVNDDLWSRFKLGERSKLKDPTTGESALRNPFSKIQSTDKFAAILADGGIDTLISRGVTVLCCNLALMRFAGQLAKEASISQDEARAQVAASVLPGIIRQPSGIFAVARAQEAGCHFIRAT